ncbi:unnamed protein product [Rhizophagus irregularis]|uniref:Uncharacterized protein n=1 Tax=Rhizophagus irregularis TaxID=588596 RepID=A0A2N1NYX8_9GLOM|nr:hypothetical protein RhiirC2_705294 [Rhizophagus irregularis]CAB4397471.1 unnamed protein product [Rhizophagus irregularis]CAB5323488.1 unnamed protein product [Rhizophagus irregularis]
MPKRKYATRSFTKNKESQVSNSDKESSDKPIKRKFTKSYIKESDDDQEITSTSKTITAEEKSQSISKSSKSPSKRKFKESDDDQETTSTSKTITAEENPQSSKSSKSPSKRKFTKSDIKESDDDQETSTSSKTITAEENPQSSKSSKSPSKRKFTKSDIKESDDDQETSTSSKTITAEAQSSSKSSESPSKYIKSYNGKKQTEYNESTPTLESSDDEQRSGTTPILPSDQRSGNDDNERRSRSTPSVDNLAIDDFHKLPAYTSDNKILKNCEKILIKQMNQIRALYDIQKATNEKVTWIQKQMKVRNSRQKNINLSEKVFGDGYNFVCAAFFPDNLWPTFLDFKNSLEGWLEKNYPNYIKELGQGEWINNFSGKHYTLLLRRMKDLRGIGVSAVKNAISKEFNLSVVGGSKRKNLKAISDWKKSKQVEVCYNKLYDDEVAIDNIAKRAFPSTTDELMLHHNYVYTASVADIILNPNYPGIEVSKKPLEKRYKKFKELLENKGSFELSDANAILEKEKETPEFIKKKRIIDDEEVEDIENEVNEVEEAPGDDNNDDYYDFLFASDW